MSTLKITSIVTSDEREIEGIDYHFQFKFIFQDTLLKASFTIEEPYLYTLAAYEELIELITKDIPYKLTFYQNSGEGCIYVYQGFIKFVVAPLGSVGDVKSIITLPIKECGELFIAALKEAIYSPLCKW